MAHARRTGKGRSRKSDPARAVLLDKLARARADFERWYSRVKRAFNQLVKARSRIIRLEKKVESLPD
jgi:hypothetical protein